MFLRNRKININISQAFKKVHRAEQNARNVPTCQVNHAKNLKIRQAQTFRNEIKFFTYC